MKKGVCGCVISCTLWIQVWRDGKVEALEPVYAFNFVFSNFPCALQVLLPSTMRLSDGQRLAEEVRKHGEGRLHRAGGSAVRFYRDRQQWAGDAAAQPGGEGWLAFTHCCRSCDIGDFLFTHWASHASSTRTINRPLICLFLRRFTTDKSCKVTTAPASLCRLTVTFCLLLQSPVYHAQAVSESQACGFLFLPVLLITLLLEGRAKGG